SNPAPSAPTAVSPTNTNTQLSSKQPLQSAQASTVVSKPADQSSVPAGTTPQTAPNSTVGFSGTVVADSTASTAAAVPPSITKAAEGPPRQSGTSPQSATVANQEASASAPVDSNTDASADSSIPMLAARQPNSALRMSFR